MKVSIRDSQKVPFWSLPGTSIQLNYLNPESGNFDPTGFTPQQRQILWVALARHILACEGVSELIDLIRPASTPPVTPSEPVVPPPNEQVIKVEKPQSSVDFKPLQNKLDDREKGLKKILRYRIATLRKELPLKTFGELKTLLALEEAWKNRKAIVVLINQLLESKQNEVAKSIEQQISKNPVTEEVLHKNVISNGIKRDLLQNISDVVDSEETTIQISVGAKTD